MCSTVWSPTPSAGRHYKQWNSVFFFCTLGWVLNMYSLLENNSHSARELVERTLMTDYRPLWQAHHHSCAVGHGRPRSRPLQFPGPFPMHLLGNSPPRKRSVSSAVQQRQPLSIIVHRKCFCCISEQQCSMKIDLSCLRGLPTLCQLRFCLPSLFHGGVPLGFQNQRRERQVRDFVW